MSTVLVNPYRYSGGAAFTPDDLFASGEAGGWYDASISASMWQETSESTSAGDTDPVGRWKDQSGNGQHLDQATAGAKPTLNTSGGLWYVAFDGSDDVLVSSGASGTQPFVMAFAVDPQAAGVNNSSDIFAGASNGPGAVACIADGANIDLFCGATLSSGVGNTTGAKVLLFYADGSSSYIRLNGSQIGSTGNAGSNPMNELCIGDHPVYGRPLQVHVYAAVFRSGTLSSGDRDSLESWLADKCGVSL